jgi:FixJ family two-component response regulator
MPESVPTVLGIDDDSEFGSSALRARFASLTEREREIVIRVVQGRLSKQIASDMGISEATVKVHRSKRRRPLLATHPSPSSSASCSCRR